MRFAIWQLLNRWITLQFFAACQFSSRSEGCSIEQETIERVILVISSPLRLLMNETALRIFAPEEPIKLLAMQGGGQNSAFANELLEGQEKACQLECSRVDMSA